MTRKKTLKLIENLANTLHKEKGMEDAASIMYVLAGTIALDNKDALNALCVYNVMWADQTLKAIQEAQKDEEDPSPTNPDKQENE